MFFNPGKKTVSHLIRICARGMCVLVSNYCKFKVKLLLNAKGLTKMNEVIPRIYGTHWSSEYTQEQDNSIQP